MDKFNAYYFISDICANLNLIDCIKNDSLTIYYECVEEKLLRNEIKSNVKTNDMFDLTKNYRRIFASAAICLSVYVNKNITTLDTIAIYTDVDSSLLHKVTMDMARNFNIKYGDINPIHYLDGHVYALDVNKEIKKEAIKIIGSIPDEDLICNSNLIALCALLQAFKVNKCSIDYKKILKEMNITKQSIKNVKKNMNKYFNFK
jgi:transcription initiation factor TFIIIB Brf1 subunit/transcription initiation factor TFIIB